MKIIIIGGGFTGVQLAKRLINERNDVTLIDNDEETVRHASNRLDCAVVNADGNNLQVLEDAGIAKADALVCLTESDEVNMITCSLADAVYPHVLKIARVRNYSYYINSSTATSKHAETFGGNHRPLYGIDFMIHPDVEAARAIVESVRNGAVSDVLTFNNSDFELIRLPVEKGSKIAGQKLLNVRSLTDKPFLIAYIESEGKTSLPSGSTVIKEGDSVGLLARKNNAITLFSLFGSHIHELKKVALVGAGRIGTIVAEQIIQKKKQPWFARFFGIKDAVKTASDLLIIDKDEELCKAMAQRLPEAHVFCADVMDESFIQEENLSKYDLVICATHNHEMNMVVAAYLESVGVRRTVTLVASSAYAAIARELKINVPIPLRDAVVDSIMSHLRGKMVTGIHTITNGEHEVVEYILPESSSLSGKYLRDIANPGSFLVMLLQKAGSKEYIIPVGNTQLSTGDRLVLITKTSETQHILDVFNGK